MLASGNSVHHCDPGHHTTEPLIKTGPFLIKYTYIHVYVCICICEYIRQSRRYDNIMWFLLKKKILSLNKQKSWECVPFRRCHFRWLGLLPFYCSVGFFSSLSFFFRFSTNYMHSFYKNNKKDQVKTKMCSDKMLALQFLKLYKVKTQEKNCSVNVWTRIHKYLSRKTKP